MLRKGGFPNQLPVVVTVEVIAGSSPGLQDSHPTLQREYNNRKCGFVGNRTHAQQTLFEHLAFFAGAVFEGVLYCPGADLYRVGNNRNGFAILCFQRLCVLYYIHICNIKSGSVCIANIISQYIKAFDYKYCTNTCNVLTVSDTFPSAADSLPH